MNQTKINKIILILMASDFFIITGFGLWSTHLDKKRESFEWSLYSTLIGVGAGVAAAIGGAVAEYAGFTMTFIIVAAVSVIGTGVLLALRSQLKPAPVRKQFEKHA